MDTDKNYSGTPASFAQTKAVTTTPPTEPIRTATPATAAPAPAPTTELAPKPPVFSIEQDMQDFIMRTQRGQPTISRTDATLAQTPVVTGRSQQSNMPSRASSPGRTGGGRSPGIPTRLYAWQGGKAGYLEISSFGFTEAET